MSRKKLILLKEKCGRQQNTYRSEDRSPSSDKQENQHPNDNKISTCNSVHMPLKKLMKFLGKNKIAKPEDISRPFEEEKQHPGNTSLPQDTIDDNSASAIGLLQIESRPPTLPCRVDLLPVGSSRSVYTNPCEDVHIIHSPSDCSLCIASNTLGLNTSNRLVPFNASGSIEARHLIENSCKNDIVDTISKIDVFFSGIIPVNEQRLIHNRVLREVEISFPPYFDFCVISSELDHYRAREFLMLLCQAFSLSGCMLCDGFDRLGADLFTQYETMIDHCTKVFFYITENFNANNFCRRLQSGAVFNALMFHAERKVEKCVPILPNGMCRIPLALAGVSGLVPRHHDILYQSICTTFCESVRENKMLLNEDIKEKRALMYETLYKQEVEIYKLKWSQQDDGTSQLPWNNANAVTFGSLPSYNNASQVSICNQTSQHNPQDSISKQNLPYHTPSLIPEVVLPSDDSDENTSYSHQPDSSRHSAANKKSKNSGGKRHTSNKNRSAPGTSTINPEKIGSFLDSLPVGEEAWKKINDTIQEPSNPSSSVNIEANKVHIGSTIIVHIHNNSESTYTVVNSDAEGEEEEDDDDDDEKQDF